MAVPSWPSALPALAGQRSAFKAQALYPAPQKTEMDDGPIRTRRRTLSLGSRVGMSLVMTPAQLVIFRAFARDDLNAGARRFTGPVIGPDLQVATRTCKIDGEVGVAPSGLQWAVTFTLYVFDGW